jgi:hypothetical protein
MGRTIEAEFEHINRLREAYLLLEEEEARKQVSQVDQVP